MNPGISLTKYEMKKSNRFAIALKRDFELYLMSIPGLFILFIFAYLPMYGVIIVFQNYIPALGILGSKWVGLKHFVTFFRDPYFFRIIRNTFLLGFYSLIFGFPAPIVFALLLNEIRNKFYKRIVQTISYMPHFLSIVIVVGLMVDLFSMSEGKVNDLVALFGGERINFFDRPEWFRPLYIGSGIWQGVGFGTIIYLASISGVNPELYESAIIDGAGRFRQAISITIPSIAPVIQVLLIFAVGGILGNDFQKIFLMYNPSTYETADVISTYVFRQGIEGAQYSYSTAVGMLTSVMSLIFLTVTNFINKKLGAEHLV